MVAKIDLKPLTEELIQEMGYSTHDLWMVKIDSTIFGPYETETLKHYVLDNENLFESAEASRSDEKEWKPFWAHTKFQRRKLQALGEMHEGPFWIMDMGLKIGPFGYREIDKKIEMGLLGMTDHLSIDNGDNWLKIYEISGFDRRSHSPDELPVSPSEASFQKAKLSIARKVEGPHLNTNDELAELAFQGQQLGKVIQLNLEELTLKHEKNVEVSTNLKPYLGRGAAAIVVICVGVYFTMSSSQDEQAQSPVAAVEKPFYQNSPAGQTPSGNIPSPDYSRSPSSVGYTKPQSYNNDSRYPTHVETHEQYQEPAPDTYQDPMDSPVAETEQPQEHSLVSDGSPEENSLESAMNGVPQAEQQPVVEEASDF
jgi:hypothetical protein